MKACFLQTPSLVLFAIGFTIAAPLMAAPSAVAPPALGARSADRRTNVHEPVYAADFDRRNFGPTISANPSGGLVAYTVEAPPVGANNTQQLFQPSGAPSNVAGSRIFLLNTHSGKTIEVCPAANTSNWRPSWSPAGKELAFYSDRDGAPRLWVYDLASNRCVRVSSAVVRSSLWLGDSPQWSDDKTLFVPLMPMSSSTNRDEKQAPTSDESTSQPQIAHVIVDTSGEILTPDASHTLHEGNAKSIIEADLARIDRATGEVHIFVPASSHPYPQDMKVSKSGKYVAYVSGSRSGPKDTQDTNVRDLVIVDAQSGKQLAIVTDVNQTGGTADWFDLGYTWSPKADTLVFFKNAKLFEARMGDDGAVRINQLGEQLGELSQAILSYSSDGNSIVVGTDPSPYEMRQLRRPGGIAKIPLDGGPIRRIEINSDGKRWTYSGVVLSNPQRLWQPEQDSVTLVLSDVMTRNVDVVRYRFDTGTRKILATFPGRLGDSYGRLFTSGTRASELYSIYESYNEPPAIYRFSPSFRRTRMALADERAVKIPVGNAAFFSTDVPVAGGALAKVTTAVLLPVGAHRGDRLPAVVMGYPALDLSRYGKIFGGGTVGPSIPNTVFTRYGYAVVLVDTKLGPAGEAGNIIQEMTDAVLPQVYHAADLGYIDIKRVAIAGQSGGGFESAAIATQTNLFRAAITVNGHYDLPGFNYGEYGNDLDTDIFRLGGPPWQNIGRYIANSPYYQVDKTDAAVLVIAGSEDDGLQDTYHYFRALKRLGKCARYLMYVGQGHHISNWSRAQAWDAASEMLSFLDHYLTGTPPSESEAKCRSNMSASN